MTLVRLAVVAVTLLCALFAFRARVKEAREAAGGAIEAVVVLAGAWQRTLPVLLLAALLLTALRGLGIVLALIWAIVTVPLIVASLVRVVVVARDGIVVAGRKHSWRSFAGFLEDAARGRVVLFGLTPETPRVELPPSGRRRAELLALLRRKLPEISPAAPA